MLDMVIKRGEAVAGLLTLHHIKEVPRGNGQRSRLPKQ
jgi:hypothetical protein